MFNIPRFLRRPDRRGETLYDDVVRQARQPIFYNAWSVPDSLDGRFDAIVLHMTMLRYACVAAGEAKGDGAMLQAMDERFILDMDDALRELGVGDLNVGKQVKEMMAAYQGRWAAYRSALDVAMGSGDTAPLLSAVSRNLLRDDTDAASPGLVAYCVAQQRALIAGIDGLRAKGNAPWSVPGEIANAKAGEAAEKEATDAA